MFAPKHASTICFAHVAYQMKATFDALDTGIHSFEVRGRQNFDRRALASKLSFIQSIGSGTNQFDKAQLAARQIRLASAAGVNARDGCGAARPRCSTRWSEPAGAIGQVA